MNLWEKFIYTVRISMFFFPMNSWDKLIYPTESNNFSHEFVGKIHYTVKILKNFNVLFSHEFMG